MSEYEITVKLLSNLHVGSGFGFARIIDRMNIKDHEKIAYIPGATIKGKLRSVCKKIALMLYDDKVCQTLSNPGVCKHTKLEELCIICRIFGSEFTEGRYHFSDAVMDGDTKSDMKELLKIGLFHINSQDEIRNNVKISRFNRISDPKHLFNLESVSKHLEFSGKIQSEDSFNKLLEPECIEAEEKLLKYGLTALTHLGGQKSRGLGRVKISCPQLGLPDSGEHNEQE